MKITDFIDAGVIKKMRKEKMQDRKGKMKGKKME